MDAHAGPPGAVVIAQDEHVEIHVQAVTQSGQRHVDVRLWRQGPSGFTPSRSALTLDLVNLDALRKGILELLESSERGTQVARIVWDHAEGQRLRAEVEPYGARYVARLGFWHRVRSSWRPADDGIVIVADRLPVLHDSLAGFRPWLAQRRREPQWVPITAQRDILDRWPAPGADWLTVEMDRVSLHPRGLRITAAADESGDAPRAVLQQWSRQDSLWLPNALQVDLSITEIEDVLTHLVALTPGDVVPAAQERVRLALPQDGGEFQLDVWCKERFQPCLNLPAEMLPRFGRTLAQTWTLLVSLLSESERDELQILHEVEPPDPVTYIETAPIHPVPDPVEPEPEVPDSPPAVHLGMVHLNGRDIVIELCPADVPHVSLRWDGESICLPRTGLSSFLADLRTLYYDALRGRRRAVAMAEMPTVEARVLSRGLDMFVVMSRNGTSLALPSQEVPAFLDALQVIINNA